VREIGARQHALNPSNDVLFLLLLLLVAARNVDAASALADEIANGREENDESNNCNRYNVAGKQNDICSFRKLNVPEAMRDMAVQKSRCTQADCTLSLGSFGTAKNIWTSQEVAKGGEKPARALLRRWWKRCNKTYMLTMRQVMSMKSSCPSRKGRETTAKSKNAIITTAVRSFCIWRPCNS
jgi:hypothetical protein